MLSEAQSIIEDGRVMPGFCVIEPHDETPTTTLEIPDRVDLRSMFGLVVNCGSPTKSIDFEEMDWVVFDRARACELNVGDKTYCITRHQDVMAILE